MRRRILLVVLTLAFVLVWVPGAAAFPDVPATQPYAAAIDDLAVRGVISGHLDGTFGPDEPVARCQLAKMIVNTLGISHTDLSMPFSDVGPADLPEFVAAAARKGITKGTNPGRPASRPGAASRAQVITMVVRALESSTRVSSLPAGICLPGATSIRSTPSRRRSPMPTVSWMASPWPASTPGHRCRGARSPRCCTTLCARSWDPWSAVRTLTPADIRLVKCVREGTDGRDPLCASSSRPRRARSSGCWTP